MADREFDLASVDRAISDPDEDNAPSVDYPDEDGYDLIHPHEISPEVSRLAATSGAASADLPHPRSNVRVYVDEILGATESNFNEGIAFMIEEYMTKGSPYPKKYTETIEYIIQYIKDHGQRISSPSSS